MVRQILSKERIIQASVALIEAGKIPTFADLARRLSIHSQALYPYFSNQAELNDAIFAWAMRQLNEQLRNKLFGLSGREGIMAFSIACRQECLAHIRLTQYLMGVHRDQANQDMQAGTDLFHDLMSSMIKPVFKRAKVRLLAGRWLRNLIIGDVINVGAGWFKNRELSSDETFEWMVSACLQRLAQEDQADE